MLINDLLINIQPSLAVQSIREGFFLPLAPSEERNKWSICYYILDYKNFTIGING